MFNKAAGAGACLGACLPASLAWFATCDARATSSSPAVVGMQRMRVSKAVMACSVSVRVQCRPVGLASPPAACAEVPSAHNRRYRVRLTQQRR